MTEDLNAEQIVEMLGLEAHPEGGHFVETHRAHATAIYYLLTSESFSALHRLTKDEVWHHYVGDAVELLLLRPDGQAERHRLGPDLAGGERPQVAVPFGTWQGARITAGGRFALCGCTVSPAFEMTDFELGRRPDLAAAYPDEADAIALLTRNLDVPPGCGQPGR